MIRVTTPLENVEALQAGDEVAISGVIYTARMLPTKGWSS